MKQTQSQCIAQLIQARAGQKPDAVVFQGVGEGRQSLTYRQLNDQMNNVVQSLNQMGVGRNDRIAIVLPNGMELATAFLTIAAGATSATLNPGYSHGEFDFYLFDLDAKALVLMAGADSPAREVAIERKIPVIELSPHTGSQDLLFELVGLAGAPARQIGLAQPDDVALVLHTSGTTSRPKMVPLTHKNLCSSAMHIQQTLELTETDRCLNIMPLFHIHGLIGVLLSSIVAGASVISTPGFDADQFFNWMQASQPSWYSAVPTMHQSVLSRASANRALIEANRLRLLRSSSAPLPPRVMAELESVFSAPVIEAYGMTEASHQMASNPLPPRARKPGSVGLPAGPEIAIMDSAENFLAAGQTGEIVIRGPNVTAGYSNNPEANQKAFTNGWFRTGDEGYFDSDGYLFLTGRLKEMINRGGEKIAPREVDEVFMEHPAVAQAVTFSLPHHTLGEDLATAVVLKNGLSATPKELREFAITRLAAHKVPSQVLILDQIPKGPTGKIQRIGLGEKLMPKLKPQYIAPVSAIEMALCNLWKDVLHIDPVGIQDNFFSNGGDSLLAVQLIARIRSVFQVDLPLGSIFREPTIAEQALLVEKILLEELDALSDEDARRMSK
jgi:acyl-CoA synthetase (AMP-forming)/AMP-acid ligase II/acyl carrier protein